jgi:hypothetical protein
MHDAANPSNLKQKEDTFISSQYNKGILWTRKIPYIKTMWTTYNKYSNETERQTLNSSLSLDQLVFTYLSFSWKDNNKAVKSRANGEGWDENHRKSSTKRKVIKKI